MFYVQVFGKSASKAIKWDRVKKVVQLALNQPSISYSLKQLFTVSIDVGFDLSLPI